ncbi:MAG: hypothetical protein A3C80_02365 [Candidatus Ryanbacteria bacterium RIFCSPHIGHO2_02_FULL_45_43]|uniref:VTT domain-containing protein n=1 Tax=Candidatus Ryanbacteria bacterium RIFCSPHIGHO2_01_45_13 TaxID=1802112 RepID=A0A1G2FWJ6_9BACT|nr:MAG: hypothetical protein A2718_00795 [Candidatus Ryanbacteria bacterium RIFCSPHIGHO2_01_FULL_44_130]OGZ42449.1 MAG: hypothetical protein A2W41_03640 [Candidatus Ryanbacteria bacterium RIFCSPHIGHO2_01_45_13]OGZ48466.1 MAG: hypothetical protein A3C80_02365 [Candidatus Ryanbacteria bacterium RIFCSPHIGHO2_02_FULL_45_43]OGZ50331.1 MAG: hypothetical protein A3E55_00265 [Candidatus Ryanbacteria bacterium RIFCSPHIGHO2_12_FULL_44_20]OGZ51670.1 MAG: hypothetical protein A3A17_02715 [Candidatus Ryanba
MGALHALYHWTLAWASHPYAALALFLLAFFESSVFPIPPDVLLIAMVVAVPLKWFRYATIAVVGSLLGGIAGYLIGYFLYGTVGVAIIDFYHAESLVKEIGNRYSAYAFLAVFSAAFTPIPYKVITLSAGFFKIQPLTFLFASLLGRGLRFFLVAGLLRIYGERMKIFIHRHFDTLAVLFVVLLIGGFLVLKFFIK